MSLYDLPVENSIGPIALARAPKDLNIPIIVPFWSSEPIKENKNKTKK